MHEEHESGPDLDLDTPFEAELEESSGGVSWLLVVGLLVAAVGVTFLAVDGMGAETYFYTVDQAVAQGTDIVGQNVRVKGKVEPGSIVGKAGELERAFRVIENGESIAVVYAKAMPDTFDENMEVVVEGVVGKDMTIDASEVLVKCPSRYEGAPPTAGSAPQTSL